MRISVLAYNTFLLIFLIFPVAAVEYQRTVEDSTFQQPEHKREQRPSHFFAERQPYLPYQNFMHYWIDRPLFTDVALRRQDNPKKAGFLKDVEILQKYGLDGYASIDYFGYHRDELRYLKEAKIQNYSQMYVMTNAPYPRLLEHVKAILKSPYTYRVNGKPVFWKYANVKTVVSLARRLSKDIGEEIIFFCGLPLTDIYNAYYVNRKTGQIPEKLLQDFRKKTQEILDICGGLILWNGDFTGDAFGEYGLRRIPSGLYRQHILPIVMELMKLERNRGKLLGISVTHGYTNHLNGPVHRENGTQMLRTNLEEGLLCNPDVILLFEWNEANENTSFQPTIANGRSMERIINYYKSRLNRFPLAPRPGDDLSCPNLILSSRQEIILGEMLHYELLYIPDGSGDIQWKVRLHLQDEKGKLLFSTQEEVFPVSVLRAVTYKLPSESFSRYRALIPVLEVVNTDGKRKYYSGFDCTRLNPTTCVNYKFTRTPLRELFQPGSWDFQIKKEVDGSYACTGFLKNDEPLASLEVTDCGDELYSSDVENEFDRKRYALFRGTFTSLLHSVTLSGDISVFHSTDWKIRPAENAWECFRKGLRFGNVEKVNTFFERMGRGTFLLSVPRKDLPNAVLNLDYEKIGKFQIKLSELEKRGKYAEIMNNQVRLELERMDNLPDYPIPMNRKEHSFSEKLQSSNREPVFQIRAITVSGKIFRSSPVIPEIRSEKVINMNVYSDYCRKAVSCLVPENILLKLNYRFTPAYGAWLTNAVMPKMDISLGGGWHYAAPAWHRQKFMPANYASISPAWKKDGKDWILDFDGKGAYLVLPQESIPRAAVFDLEFELKFASLNNQVLIRPAAGEYRGSLGLFLENGKLKGIYYGQGSSPRIFQTELTVPQEKWCRIGIRKDFSSVTFTVNDRKTVFSYDRRGKYFQHFTFGGDLGKGKGLPENAGTFHGQLRKFVVKHY